MHGRKKGGWGRENPAFQSSHAPRLREIQNTPSSPAVRRSPRRTGAIRERSPSDGRGDNLCFTTTPPVRRTALRAIFCEVRAETEKEPTTSNRASPRLYSWE